MAIASADKNTPRTSFAEKNDRKIDQANEYYGNEKQKSNRLAVKNTKKEFETSKITDWIKTKPSSVLIRVREREKRVTENRTRTNHVSAWAESLSQAVSFFIRSR